MSRRNQLAPPLAAAVDWRARRVRRARCSPSKPMTNTGAPEVRAASVALFQSVAAAVSPSAGGATPKGGGTLPSMSPQQLAGQDAAVADDDHLFTPGEARAHLHLPSIQKSQFYGPNTGPVVFDNIDDAVFIAVDDRVKGNRQSLRNLLFYDLNPCKHVRQNSSLCIVKRQIQTVESGHRIRGF